jgi:hypothetical protein
MQAITITMCHLFATQCIHNFFCMHAAGDYDTTKELLNCAVKFVGADTRRGGEYKLWLAQVGI